MEAKRASKIVSMHVRRGASERRDWDRWTNWYTSDFYADEPYDGNLAEAEPNDDLHLETNYPFAFIDTMIANVVPTNPQVTISERNPDAKESAEARERLINDTLKRDKFHAKLSKCATFASLCGRGFIKTVWSKRKRSPVSRTVDPRRVFFDMSTDFEDARYIFEAVPLTKDEFKERVKSKMYDETIAAKAEYGKMPEWMVDKSTAQPFCDDASQDVFKWVVVYEFYDLVEKKFFHLLENIEEPLFEGPLPYAGVENTFTLMVFNDNQRDAGGLSDVKLIEGPQERLNELDSLELNFAHKSIPLTILNESLVDDPEAARTMLASSTGPMDVASLAIRDSAPLTAVIGSTPVPNISPSFDKMRKETRGNIEFILGLPQYQRGATGTSEVATELALVDTAARTRNGRRIKVIEDVVVSVAKKILGLWKQKLEEDRTIAVRDESSKTTAVLDRVALAFPVPGGEEEFDDEWAYDYECAPYSPTENHRLVQLQKVQQFAEILFNSPFIEQQGLYNALLKLIELDGITTQQPQQPGQPGQPGQPQPGQPGGPGQGAGAPQGMSGMPTKPGGEMPDGIDTDFMLPPNTRQQAAQPKVG